MQFSIYNEFVTMKKLIQKRITECGNIKKIKNKYLELIAEINNIRHAYFDIITKFHCKNDSSLL